MEREYCQFEENVKIIMIDINISIHERSTIQECIRSAWRINRERAMAADYILAVDKIIVKDVFEIEDIVLDTEDPELKRKLIHTKDVSNQIKQQYKDKYIPERYMGFRYPILYNYDWIKNKPVMKK